MHEVLVNCLGGLSLPRKSVVRLTDRPDMTLDVYRGRKTTMQQQHWFKFFLSDGQLLCCQASCPVYRQVLLSFIVLIQICFHFVYARLTEIYSFSHSLDLIFHMGTKNFLGSISVFLVDKILFTYC